jgi:hypothetical protein
MDDQAAIRVVDGNVDIISEGTRRLLGPGWLGDDRHAAVGLPPD